jgi:chemotaxis protein CheD
MNPNPTTIDLDSGDVKIAYPSIRLRAPALGSCVAVVLYDRIEQIGGMAHVMLPSTDHYLLGDDVLKYADEAIPYLVKMLVDAGANRYGLYARLVGGAMIIEDTIDIGGQVVKSCQNILNKYGIKIVSQKVGGNKSRNVTLDVATSVVWYSENGGVEKVL